MSIPKLQLQTLSSSSSGCCYILREGDSKPLLLEAGVSLARIQEAANYQLSGLAGCLVTHLHGDHAKSAGQLMKRGVTVYSAMPTLEHVFNSDPEAEQYQNHREIEIMQRLHVGPWEVLPFDVVHDTPQTLGFVITSPEQRKFLFLTDSAYCRYKFRDLTHIAIECNWANDILVHNTRSGVVHGSRASRTRRTHMSLEQLTVMLQANDLSRVEWITLLHLSRQNSDRERFIRDVRAATGVPTYAAGYTDPP